MIFCRPPFRAVANTCMSDARRAKLSVFNRNRKLCWRAPRMGRPPKQSGHVEADGSVGCVASHNPAPVRAEAFGSVFGWLSMSVRSGGNRKPSHQVSYNIQLLLTHFPVDAHVRTRPGTLLSLQRCKSSCRTTSSAAAATAPARNPVAEWAEQC